MSLEERIIKIETKITKLEADLKELAQKPIPKPDNEKVEKCYRYLFGEE